jgi:histidinol-phosphate aminotransferase
LFGSSNKTSPEQGFEIIPSTANFMFIKHEKISGAELFQLLREKGILVRHFNKARIEQYLRVSIGTDEEMNAFVEIINGVQAKFINK